MKCDHRSPDGYCDLQKGYCHNFLDWPLCIHEDREFTIITIILVLFCLSVIGMMEMVERGWITF